MHFMKPRLQIRKTLIQKCHFNCFVALTAAYPSAELVLNLIVANFFAAVTPYRPVVCEKSLEMASSMQTTIYCTLWDDTRATLFRVNK